MQPLLALLVATSLTGTAPAWPQEGVALRAPDLPATSSGRKLRIALDAGHGAPDNHGALSAYCEDEEVFTLALAEAVKAELEETGRFEVRLTRSGDKRPTYQERLRQAQAWPADALVSLHSDARGMPVWWEPKPGLACLRQDATPGFAILWSDDAPPALSAKRSTLAAAVADRMSEAGFLPYDGVDYEGLYDHGPVTGAFVDRHVPGRRIFMLRRPRIPSIIVETHHALDVAEVARWAEPATHKAFSAALAAALLDALAPPKPAVTTAARKPEAPPRR